MDRPALDPLIGWLFSLQGPSLKWDIETARAFCAVLGHPERRFRSAHIAGTNGKGSVAAFLHAIALESGLVAGLYTSPHLVRPEERIRPGAEEMDSAAFREVIDRLRRVAGDALEAGLVPRHPSFFEIMTAAAFDVFATARVDLAILEAGLGGRLDATNIVVPELSVITTIGLDHVQTLGPGLVAIAREKAGIVKPGVPVLAGWIPARPLEVISRAAADVGAPLHRASRELTLRRRADGTFDLATPERDYAALAPALSGWHQLRNAALAVRAAELLARRGVALEPGAFARGLAAVRWPGRMERIGRVLLDGAHNVDWARALGKALADLDRARGRRRRVLVFGVTEGRDPARLAAPLAAHVDRIVVARPDLAKGADTVRVTAALRATFAALEPEAVGDVAAALARAETLAGADGEVLVAGSLYLVGDARRALLGIDGTGHPSRETSVAAAVRRDP